jgi:hypothetical protein
VPFSDDLGDATPTILDSHNLQAGRFPLLSRPKLNPAVSVAKGIGQQVLDCLNQAIPMTIYVPSFIPSCP